MLSFQFVFWLFGCKDKKLPDSLLHSAFVTSVRNDIITFLKMLLRTVWSIDIRLPGVSLLRRFTPGYQYFTANAVGFEQILHSGQEIYPSTTLMDWSHFPSAQHSVSLFPLSISGVAIAPSSQTSPLFAGS